MFRRNPLVGKDVVPGGTNFGVRPSDCGAPAGDDSPFEAGCDVHSQLKLKIKLSHDSFWAFEPIEMDLTLSFKGEKQKTISLPKEIDPAYETFHIWITNPRGERRIFKSDHRICRSNGKLRLSQGESFRRDISLLRELGHATFGIPGAYEIQAMIRLRDGRLVPSNLARCTVKAPKHGRVAWEEAQKILHTPSVQRLFRHKEVPPPEQEVKALIGIAERSSAVTRSMIHYTLGKSFACQSKRSNEERSRGEFRELAIVHLQRALSGSEALGLHRRTLSRELLSKLESVS